MSQQQYRRGTHPRSLANLNPWQPGQTGNPNGRRKGIVYAAEWMNAMTDWPVEKVQAVLDDPDTPITKKTAARQLLKAVGVNPDKAIPVPMTHKDEGDSADRVMDRTEGKPIQKTQVLIHDDRDLETQIDAFFVRIRRSSAAIAVRSVVYGSGGADLPAGPDRVELDSQ